MSTLGVARYFAKLVTVLFLVSIVTFLLLELIPGDPVAAMLPAGATPEGFAPGGVTGGGYAPEQYPAPPPYRYEGP